MVDLPRIDPLPGYNFYIALIDTSTAFTTAVSSLTGFLLGGFAECSGLDFSQDITEYQEGGVNDRVHKFPGRNAYSNITLKRGVGFGEDLWLWVEDWRAGKGVRKNGLIALANEGGLPIKLWSFERALPVKWTGPTLNATSSELAIESLEIAHERLELLVSPGKLLDSALDAVF